MQYIPVLPALREVLPVFEQHVMSNVIYFTALHELARSNHITRNHGAEN